MTLGPALGKGTPEIGWDSALFHYAPDVTAVSDRIGSRSALRQCGGGPPPFTENPCFTASVAIMGIGGLANFATLFALPLHCRQAHGHGVLASGLLTAPVGLGGAFAMPLARRLSDRIGTRGLAAAGALTTALSTAAFTPVGAHTDELWPVLLAFTAGLGMGAFSAPTMGSLYRTLPAPMIAQGRSVLYMDCKENRERPGTEPMRHTSPAPWFPTSTESTRVPPSSPRRPR
ncbi:MFS transporter [Embleya sp. NPDC050493]|uniref:MFS transporter n=1 Tax=Embleya sp. NPDC050493 TaxID=3363989 RepID=UPI0037903119